MPDLVQDAQYKFEKTYQEYFSCYPNKDWDIVTKINHMQRRVLIHSLLCYDMDENIITDYYFDEYCRALLDLQNKATKEECEKTRYWYAFYDFDATTGHHFRYRLNNEDLRHMTELANLALYCHEMHEHGMYGRDKYEYAKEHAASVRKD